MSSALFDFNAIFLRRFLILISLRRAESNHGLSFGLITTDFSGIHSLISVKIVFEKFSAALSISLAPRINSFEHDRKENSTMPGGSPSLPPLPLFLHVRPYCKGIPQLTWSMTNSHN